MMFGQYIKSARERCKMTQNALADKIDVSVTTIQNWENETNLPDKSFWEIIITTLQLDKDEFVKQYAGSVLPEKQCTQKTDFPECLFPEKKLDEVLALQLTADEQELFGMEEIYGYSENLPYEYVHRVGMFNIINLHNSLHKKIDKYSEYVRSCILEYPNKIFDVQKCTPIQLWKLLDYMPDVRTTNCYHISYTEYMTELISVLNILHNMDEPLPISVTAYLCQIDNNGDCYYHGYKVMPYHSDEWYDIEVPNGLQHLSEYIQSAFICEIQQECQDEKYRAAKQKYKQDLEFYEQHKSMLDYPPQEPEYQGVRYLQLTEKGKALLKWYNENMPTEM